MAQIRERGFIWIPRSKDTQYTIYVDGIDVTQDVISSEWTRAIIGLEAPCKLTLIDSDGKYAEDYTGGETVELKLDFSAGTTSQWKGKLERPKKKFGAAYTLELIGSHFQTDLLDITVTESFTSTLTCDAILKQLVDTYLTGYTYVNVQASTVVPNIKWDNKPFWDCVVDLCGLADADSAFDAYLDSDKDFHFFRKNSIENEIDAIVWQDNLLEIENLGIDTVDVKNRIIVYGEDTGGNPIIYQTDDTASQATHGIKEKVIKDTSVKTYTQAKELGDLELNNQMNTLEKGEVTAIILPDLHPGDLLWVTDPVQKVHGQYRLVKYTHFLPVEQTKCVFSQEKTIPQLFKDRRKSELALQSITNPYKMQRSYNFPFDDTTDMDLTLSSNVEVSESKLKVTTGIAGTMISLNRNTITNITQVHLKVIGDALAGTIYYISTNNGDTYTAVNTETLTYVTAGSNLRAKIELNSASTRIDSFAVLYK